MTISRNPNYSWFMAWKNNPQASMIVDINFDIIDFNTSCKTKFALTDHKPQNLISVFKNMNEQVWNKKNLPQEFSAPILIHQNNLIEKILRTSHDDNIAISFAYFLVENDEFRSKLVQIIPFFDQEQNFYYSQLIISEFTMWASATIIEDFIPPKSSQTSKLMDSNHRPSHKLTEHQYNILFPLSYGLSIRSVADMFGLSYGNISKLLREIIAPKFGILDGNTEKVIEELQRLGYRQLIPQLLCRPFIHVLDDLIIAKSGLE